MEEIAASSQALARMANDRTRLDETRRNDQNEQISISDRASKALRNFIINIIYKYKYGKIKKKMLY